MTAARIPEGQPTVTWNGIESCVPWASAGSDLTCPESPSRAPAEIVHLPTESLAVTVVERLTVAPEAAPETVISDSIGWFGSPAAKVGGRAGAPPPGDGARMH